MLSRLRPFSLTASSFLIAFVPAALVLVAPVGLAAAQSDSAAVDAPTIAVDVDLVVLPATVRDHAGHLVADLHQNDFAIYEDGVRQTLRLFRHEDVPVTVGLVIDHSGSMKHKLADVVAAARLFARSSNPDDQFFVVNFNEHVTLGLPRAVGFTSRTEELERAIGATPADGQTALYDAVLEGLERSRAGVPDRKVLIVFSDGGDNASAHALAEVLKKVSESSVVIYTLGIFEPEDPDQNPDVLRRLARVTGGDAFFPAQFNEVEAICGRIAHYIRNEYTLGYSSNSSAAPGTRRALRVEAHAAGRRSLSVRTRSGYMASPEGHAK